MRRLTQNEEHERMLGRPYYAPLPPAENGRLAPVPALWDRACEFMAQLMRHVGATRDVARRWHIRRRDRREVMKLLSPVEKLVRCCLIIQAATWLLMTPEGRRMVREVPKQQPPEPRKPFQKVQPHRITIPHPGWNTIAQMWRPETPPPPKPEPKDKSDPANWRCGFPVVGWNRSTRDPDAPPERRRMTADHLIIAGDVEHAGALSLKQKHEKHSSGLILARRIEALARVIANPEPAIRRAARFLAGVSLSVLATLEGAASSHTWDQGRAELLHANLHLMRAVSVLARPIEPG